MMFLRELNVTAKFCSDSEFVAQSSIINVKYKIVNFMKLPFVFNNIARLDICYIWCVRLLADSIREFCKLSVSLSPNGDVQTFLQKYLFSIPLTLIFL